MSYFEILSDKAVSLGQQIADGGDIAHVTGYLLARELVNEALSQQSLEEMIGYHQCDTALFGQVNDAAMKELGGILQQVTNVTFNDATPMIKSIIEKMNEVINPDIPVAYSTSEVVPILYHEIWNSPLVMDAVIRGRRAVPAKVSFAGMIKSITDDEYANVAELAMTGVPSVDEMIASLLATFEGNSLVQLFQNVFRDGFLPSENPIEVQLNGDIAKDEWIVIGLWSRKLRDIPPRLSAFDLDRYRMNLTALDQMVDRVICGVDELRQLQSKTEQLILDIRNSGKKVVVNNDLYISFLRDGGSPEAVLGTTQVGSTRRQYSLTAVKEGQAEFEKAWSRHVSASTASHQQNMHATARRQFHIILDQIAAQRVADEKLAKESLNGVLNAIAVEIGKLPTDFLVDLHRWVFDIVGRVFYPNSGVCSLLTNLREVGDIKDSGFSAEEVRVLACINFMGDWIADVITKTPHGGGKGLGNYLSESPSYSWGMESIDAMGMEKLEGVPGSLKEWAQLLGLMVLGAGVGYAIGTLLNKLFYGKSKADKAKKAADKLEEMGIKEVPLKDVVEKIKSDERFAEGVPRIFADMIEQNSEWQKLVKSVSMFDPQPAKLVGMAHSLFERNGHAVDDRAADRLVHEANDLTDKLITSTNGMANAMHVLGLNVKVPSGDNATVDSLMAVVEGFGAWEEEFTGRIMAVVPVDRISTSGSLQVMSVVSDIKANAKAMEEGMESAASLMKSGNKRIDDEASKEAANYNDATKAAVARLGAAFKAWSRLAIAYVETAAVATNAGIGVAMIVHGIKDIDK